MHKSNYRLASVADFFNGPLFNPAFKTRVHYFQLFLVVVMIGFTGARIATKPSFIPVSRADLIGIIMGIKTLIVLAYQMLTTHVARLQRWKSLKAYLILNMLEIMFWLAVVVLTFMGISTYCKAVYCGLSWIVAVIAITLTLVAFWTAVVSYRVRKESKQVQVLHVTAGK